MELREFVKQALCDIARAVDDAKSQVKGAEIIPAVSHNFKSVETGISEIQPIEFEVAVTTEQVTE